MVLGLTGRLVYLENQNKKLNNDNSRLYNNVEAYQEELDSTKTAGHTLELKLSDLSHSKNKAIQTIDSLLKVRKIKKETVKSGTVVDQNTHHQGTDSIPHKTGCDFTYIDSTLLTKSNGLSRLEITVKGDSITRKLDISNQIAIVNYYKNEWVEPKFFKRLFKFNWKKRRHDRFESSNTNPTIDTKITSIEIKQDK